jgi:hypothetical protein
MRSALLATLAVFLVACPLGPHPAPVDPDYPADATIVETFPEDSAQALSSPCGKACSTLLRLGCPEGSPSATGVTCYRTCVRMTSLRRIPATCWASAETVAQLRLCGGVRCVP